MQPPRDHEVRGRYWKLLALVALVALAFLLPVVTPVASVVTGAPVPGVSLRYPLAYLLLAPICGIMDALTALSLSQHIAVLSVTLSLYALWRLFRLRKPERRHGFLFTPLLELGWFAVFLVCLVGFYAVGILVPRPMARLHVDDPDVVVVDFHSHTAMSHDGRKSFTAQRNRAWHHGAGFDVAYVTDHDSIRAGVEAATRNPPRAGDGTLLFPGREVVYRGMHVVVLGTFDPRTRTSSTDPCGPWPVVIGTIPGNLDRVPAAECPGPDHGGGVSAIELLDAAPKGLDESDRDRARILYIADSLHVAVVADSDNHGWGSTAVGWSLMRIPGWRDMTPDSLNATIKEMIRSRGRDAVQVVALRRPREAPDGVWASVLPVLMPQSFISKLSREERLSWIVWIAVALWGWGMASGRRRGAASG
jgi:hypothetical protein